VRRFIPAQLTSSRYEDAAGRKLQMVLGNYGGSAKAWLTWQLLRVTAGLTAMREVPMNGGSALSSIDGNTEYLLFRRGGCLGLVSAPNDRSGLSLRLAEAVRQ
jgi:hypothetical protein